MFVFFSFVSVGRDTEEEESEAKRGPSLFGNKKGVRVARRGGGVGRTGVGRVSAGRWWGLNIFLSGLKSPPSRGLSSLTCLCCHS